MVFEWDDYKAKLNIKNHGVSFEEASEAFFDPNAIFNYDSEHSGKEPRFFLIGFSSRRLLFVVYAERNATEEIIRIISARKAEGKYQAEYRETNYEN